MTLFYISWIVAPMIKYVDYLSNLKIYKERCINKEKEKLLCNGKCQIFNQKIDLDLKKPNLNLYSYDFTFSYFLNKFLLKNKYFILINKFNFEYINQYNFIYKNALFKPPIL